MASDKHNMQSKKTKHFAFTADNIDASSEEVPIISDSFQQRAQLPLFITSPHVLDSNRHAKAGIRLNQTMAFARYTNSIPLNVTEFAEAAKYYPIVFTTTEPVMPIIILGLDQENYFINAQNNWEKGAYIPAYVRKYPFVFVKNSFASELTLCVDESAPHFVMQAEEGGAAVRFYDDQGKPTSFARNALAFCLAVQQDYDLSRKFCEELAALNILIPCKVDATFAEGEALSLGGFQQLDQEKFRQLPDEKIAHLLKKEWLAPIYYLLQSSSNWKILLDKAPLSKQSKKPRGNERHMGQEHK